RTRCGIRSPRTCCRPARICAPSRNCSATSSCRRRSAIHTSTSRSCSTCIGRPTRVRAAGAMPDAPPARANQGVRCRNAFQSICVHANGEVVCSIIDGRGDFVVGNVHQQSLSDILNGSRARELRALVLSTADSYCRAIGKCCPLKTIPFAADEHIDTTLRYLVIEPSTACDLKCLACPVRDFKPSVT